MRSGTEEFGLLIALIYQRQGYRVSMPAGAGGGRGGDFTLLRKSERVLVQCKRLDLMYRVPVDRVRELHEAMTTAGLTRGMYVASCGFTWDARNFAKTRGITVINARTLDELLAAAREKPDEDLLAVSQWAPKLMSKVQMTPPLCPACDATMDQLNVSNGSVWVCSQRPECRGRRITRKYQKTNSASARKAEPQEDDARQTEAPRPSERAKQPSGIKQVDNIQHSDPARQAELVKLAAMARVALQAKRAARDKQEEEAAQANQAGQVTPATPAPPASQARPVTPATPANRAAPASQARPVTPATPGNGAAPASQARPVTPATPANRAAPASQARPVTPATPGNGAAPASQARPVTPATPGNGAGTSESEARPVTPATPGNRTAPASQARPVTPATPANRAAPASQARPVTPATPGNRDTPASQARPVTPATPANRAAPASQPRPVTPATPQRSDRTCRVKPGQ